MIGVWSEYSSTFLVVFSVVVLLAFALTLLEVALYPVGQAHELSS
jgi:hypothetical protein